MAPLPSGRNTEKGGGQTNGDNCSVMISRLSTAYNHGTIDIPEDTVPRRGWIQTKFTTVYALLVVIALVCMATFIVCLVLTIRLQDMGRKYDDASLSFQERFKSIFALPPPQTSETNPQLSPPRLPPTQAPYPPYPPEPRRNDELEKNEIPVPPPLPVTVDPLPPKPSKPGSWHDPSCASHGICPRTDFPEPPLLVLSFDGFANEYVKRRIVKNLERIAECGATAQHVFPSYPTKTFPNHYSIMTGLFPESHGVVDNSVYDPSIADVFENLKTTKDNRYFQGEPLWTSVTRQTKKRVACLYWVGCNYNASGFVSDEEFNPVFNDSVTSVEKVKKILTLLSLPEDKRPALIAGYFNEPDHTGHRQMHSDEVMNNVLRTQVDDVLELLLNALRLNGMLECVNIVILSDHGMQKLDRRKFIALENHVKTKGLLANIGPVARIYLNGTKTPPDELIRDFHCSKGKQYRVYSPWSIPARVHHAATKRVGDIILDGQPGTKFFVRKVEMIGPYHEGDHGYDYIHPSMHSIFFARGPSIRPRMVLPPFQNVEYYYLFEELLNLPERAERNGTRGTFNSILINPTYVESRPILLSECRRLQPDANVLSCTSCSEEDRSLLQMQMSFFLNQPPGVESQLGFGSGDFDFCVETYYDMTIVKSATERNASRVIVESLATPLLPQRFNNCTYVDGRYSASCAFPSVPPEFEMKTLLVYDTNKYAGVEGSQVPLHKEFVRAFYEPLQNMTLEYLHKYGRLLSFTGTIYDYDTDGRADTSASVSIPSHIFRILMACQKWRGNSSCESPSDASVIAFIMPHIEREFNCLDKEDLLLTYSARVRDIELMTGIQFFADRRIVDSESARVLRTHVTERLW